jgi:MarR family transcriptional regulator, organic hydroperoxide resistance regulator
MKPTGPRPVPPDQAQTDVERKLERIGELIKRMLASMRFPDDASELTPTQLVVLSNLEEGPMRVGVLAAAAGAAQNTISEVVARLQRSGLVSKQRDPSDHRAVLVGLTAQGTQALESRRTAMRSAHRTVLEALSTEDRQRFVDAFEVLVEMTERARVSISESWQQARRSR